MPFRRGEQVGEASVRQEGALVKPVGHGCCALRNNNGARIVFPCAAPVLPSSNFLL